jgi:hypothetical protein
MLDMIEKDRIRRLVLVVPVDSFGYRAGYKGGRKILWP